MNKKGFTLIELLAVLVIIGLVGLITVTSITSLLKNYKNNIYDKQIDNIEEAARIWGADNLLVLPNDSSSTNICNYAEIENCDKDYRKLTITLAMLQQNGYISKDLKNPKTKERFENVTIDIERNGNNLKYTVNVSEEEDTRYKEIILNGADPILSSDMVPVIIENNGTVKKANIEEEWYKYEDKEWANAVVLNSNQDYANGDTIPESNIKAYYVWIPRYKYQLFSSSSPVTINIVFESSYTNKSLGTNTGQYRTHSAFTLGTQELEGFWVGKFETTGNSTTPTIKPYMSDNDNSTITSLRNQNVSTQYQTAVRVSANSMMMKNDEWGAVAYLSHSNYGVKTDIRINNNSGYKTGCGAGTDNKAAAASCDIEYGKEEEYPQSTTGNITGIFDMSGGAWEYMMAVRSDTSGKPLSGRHNIYNSGFNGKYGCPTCDSTTTGVDSSALALTSGTNFPDSRYYNLYYNPNNPNSIDGNNGCNGIKCYGHALTETANWYSDYYYFPSTGYPWVVRGGYCSNGASAGVFGATYNDGRAYGYCSFRVVVPTS